MRILVTGVTGFLGGRVAARLDEAGHDVRGLVRDASRWTDKPDRAEAVPGDVTDSDSLRRAVADCAAVVHCAAFVKSWAKDRGTFDRVNVGGLRNVIATAGLSGARLSYTSSFLALGPTDGTTLDETSPHMGTPPYNDYERTKRDADRAAREAALAGARIVRIYPGVVYGPGALTDGNHVVQNLILHAKGKLPGMLGDGDRRLSLAFVDDVTSGYAEVLARAKDGSAYVLGGDNKTLVDLFAAFEKETGIAPPKIKIPYAAARLIGRLQRWRAELFGTPPELTDEVVGIYTHEWAYSSARAQADLGYTITPLAAGVAKTVAWLRTRGVLPAAGSAAR